MYGSPRVDLQRKIAAGFGRHRAVEGAVEGAGHAGAGDGAVEGIAGAVRGNRAGGCQGVAVEIADREGAGAEIVSAVETAGRHIIGAVVGHRADRMAVISFERALRCERVEVGHRGRHGAGLGIASPARVLRVAKIARDSNYRTF